jgi:hypothetical protein
MHTPVPIAAEQGLPFVRLGEFGPHDAQFLRLWLFLLKMGLALAACILLILTLLWRHWIELRFGYDPDNHDGLVELPIPTVLFGVAHCSSLFEAHEWHRGCSAEEASA